MPRPLPIAALRAQLPAVVALAATLAGAGCGSSTHPHRPTHVSRPAAAPIAPRPMARSVPSSCRAQGRLYTEGLHLRDKVVALTFDDGPSPYTHHILDVLEAKHVVATFFVIGQQVSDEPDQVRRALRDGDLIGNHTYTHPDMLKVALPGVIDEIGGAQQAIWQDTGFVPCFWRAPYGSINEQLKYIARSYGLLSIQWDTDPQDFTAPPADAIYRRVLFGNPKNPDPGVHPGAIVLMHDGGGNRSHTVQALPRIIDALRQRGYRFVTVAGLLNLALIHERR